LKLVRTDRTSSAVRTSRWRWLDHAPEYMLGDELDEPESELPPMFGQFAELPP